LATINFLAKFIKTGKDQLDPLSCCDVVEINCRNCDASYAD